MLELNAHVAYDLWAMNARTHTHTEATQNVNENKKEKKIQKMNDYTRFDLICYFDLLVFYA